jgi:HAD superfamily hydrolase (TIGR01509 family)
VIKALVFDFDGLILETELPVYQSWLELFQRHALELPFELWCGNIGTADAVFDPVATLCAHGSNGDRLEQDLVERHSRELELIGDQPPMPGVLQILQEARQMELKIGLASSSSCAWVEGHLARLGLRPFFDCVLAKDDVRSTKPDPELFRSAAELLGVLPEEAIAFEDSPNGIRSAKLAGLHCVAVPNLLTRRMDTSQADLVLDSLEGIHLTDLIEML